MLAAEWGASDVVGVDLSDAVESAFAATRNAENMHVVQADLCRLPLKRVFDYAYTIGVIHHLIDPSIGFKSLASKIKPGGHFSVWVYGAENNRWITTIVNPLRTRFTSRMNRRALLHLSKVPTALLYAASSTLFESRWAAVATRVVSSASRRQSYLRLGEPSGPPASVDDAVQRETNIVSASRSVRSTETILFV